VGSNIRVEDSVKGDKLRTDCPGVCNIVGGLATAGRIATVRTTLRGAGGEGVRVGPTTCRTDRICSGGVCGVRTTLRGAGGDGVRVAGRDMRTDRR